LNKYAIYAAAHYHEGLLAVAEHYEKTDLVVRLLADYAPTDVEWITVALARLGPKASAAVPTLTALLDNPSEHVRQRAAYILGKIGPAAVAAIPALQRRLRDEHLFVRWHAADAIEKISPAGM
jgi:HEAT repeat protein